MKTLLLSLTLAAFALAQDAPRPLSLEDQETLSRAMILAQQAELNALQAAHKADQAEGAYDRLLAQLQKKSKADGCEITVEKQWKCPASPSSAAPTTP